MGQEMIQFMLKYSFFHKQVTQIPESIIVSKEIDFEIMKKAFNIEIERNDCLRLRFFKENGKIKQYFLDEFKSDVFTLHNVGRYYLCGLCADTEEEIKAIAEKVF